jgi:hypothetical protein
MTGKVEITGLKEFQKSLRDADAGLPKLLRLVLNDAANLVLDYARPKVPTKTGRARSSLKARSSQRAVRIAVGGTKAPYYPWLDFGGEGKVRGRPTPRPFIRSGRYLYPGLAARHEQVQAVMSAGLADLAKSAGMDVT